MLTFKSTTVGGAKLSLELSPNIFSNYPGSWRTSDPLSRFLARMTTFNISDPTLICKMEVTSQKGKFQDTGPYCSIVCLTQNSQRTS